jgi:hypothetical protein
VVVQGLVKVVAEVPANAQAIGCDLHELSLGSDALEEHHQLQAKEYYRIDTGAPHGSIRVSEKTTLLGSS